MANQTEVNMGFAAALYIGARHGIVHLNAAELAAVLGALGVALADVQVWAANNRDEAERWIDSLPDDVEIVTDDVRQAFYVHDLGYVVRTIAFYKSIGRKDLALSLVAYCKSRTGEDMARSKLESMEEKIECWSEGRGSFREEIVRCMVCGSRGAAAGDEGMLIRIGDGKAVCDRCLGRVDQDGHMAEGLCDGCRMAGLVFGVSPGGDESLSMCRDCLGQARKVLDIEKA